jgi:hypothetical protein
MDVLIATIIAIAFIIITIVTSIVSSKIVNYIRKDTLESNNLNQEEINNYRSISTGYAYAVDAVDSIVIVVVLDKKNQYKDFLNAQPMPIKIRGIENAE